MEGITKLQAGEQVDQFLLIKQSTKGVTTVGKPFMSLLLQDKSGDIEAKLWDTNEEHEQLYKAEAVAPVRVNSLIPYGRINSIKASIFSG